jgi:tetratricopeptide (TPR) repeat protein
MSSARVRAEFERLVELAAAAREAALAVLSTTDHALAEQVRDLLRQDAAASGFLERAAPAAGPASLLFAPGQRFGRYELVRPLGRGGMGTVFAAVQHDPERTVALKLLAHTGRAAAERWRFEQEVQVLAALSHPAIATFHEAGVTATAGGDVAWLAMELVAGATDLLSWAERMRLSRPARLALFLQLCDAVAYGHRRGVLHRDLKPSNVLVDSDGRLKLIDFGIARAVGGPFDGPHTHTGEVVGTLHYMAPEQLRGRPDAIGTGCDVYALGVLLYHLLCGRAPFDFRGKSLAEVTAMVLDGEPLAPRHANPDLPEDLGWILLRAMAKELPRRYPSVEALADDVQRFQAHLPIAARAPSLGYRATKFVRRNRVGVAISTAVAFGLGVGVYGLWRGLEQARASESLAVQAGAEARRGEAAAIAAQAAAELAREEARRGERAALRANEVSREMVRILAGLFDGIDDSAFSRDITVHEVLEAAALPAGAIREPSVEQAVREVRGRAFLRMHRFDAARVELERASELQRLARPEPGSPQDAASIAEHGWLLQGLLGRALLHTGEAERGEALLREMVAATATGVKPAVRIAALEQFCGFLAEQNQHAPLVANARELLELLPPDHHRSLVLAQQWLARGASSLGDHGTARQASEQATTLAAAHLGEDARLRCGLQATYVHSLQESGDLAAAAQHFPALIALTRQVYGEGHDNLLIVLNNHAHLLFSLGKRREAIDALRAVVEAHEGRGGPMTEAHLQALHNLGMVLNLSGRFAAAEPLLAAAAEHSRRLFDARNVDGVTMRFNHGACLAWSKRWQEAEPLLLAEYAALEALLPAGHEQLAKARRTIADAYRHNGHAEQGDRWRSQ